MNWDALAAVGEVTGAIAVVATLFYLSFQIRQNTRSLRASNLQSVIITSTQFLQTLYCDPQLALLWDRGREDLEQLNDAEERTQFKYMFFTFARLSQNVFQHANNGLMPHEDWLGYKESIRLWFAGQGSQQCGTEFRPRFSESFRNLIDNELSSDDAKRGNDQ
jgi:hypothetical protein